MRLAPSAMLANMTALWLIDLSPGTLHCPTREAPLWMWIWVIVWIPDWSSEANRL
jgi:hypothetical protein